MTTRKQHKAGHGSSAVGTRYPFPDFENTAELDRELAVYIEKAVPPMAKYQDGEWLVRRYRDERTYRTGKHAAYVADFVARYEAAEAREKAELPLFKLQVAFAIWRKAERLPDWSARDLDAHLRYGTGKQTQIRVTEAQRRIIEDFSNLMMKAGRREGFLTGRQGFWIITIPSPWSERAPLCWRVPLPDGRDYRQAAIVPAMEFLQTWMIMHPSLHDIVMADAAPDDARELPGYLAKVGISVRLVVEAAAEHRESRDGVSNHFR
jgi:hypothetical protein